MGNIKYNQSFKVDASQIDISNIYGSKQDAINGTDAIYISDRNSSWKSDDLTAKVNEDGSILIMNHGIGIGWGNKDTIKYDEVNNTGEIPQYDPNGFQLNPMDSDLNPNNLIDEDTSAEYVSDSPVSDETIPDEVASTVANPTEDTIIEEPVYDDTQSTPAENVEEGNTNSSETLTEESAPAESLPSESNEFDNTPVGDDSGISYVSPDLVDEAASSQDVPSEAIDVSSVSEPTYISPSEMWLPEQNVSIDQLNLNDEIYKKSGNKEGIDDSIGKIVSAQSYTVVPDSEYTNAPYTISQSDYQVMVCQVAGEGGASNADLFGVTSTILNRLDANPTGSVSDVLSTGYWPWGKTCLSYMPKGVECACGVGTGSKLSSAAEVDKLNRAHAIVDLALSGVRNLPQSVKYYGGGHVHDGKCYNNFGDHSN